MSNVVTKAALWGEEFPERIERRLADATRMATVHYCPPKLKEALQYAVFPGGSRIRPYLCLAVAKACRAPNAEIVDAVATAVELLHCASLVHDDLACFDDASLRRGRAALHRAFGEPLAVLAGDGLVVLAFEELAEAARNWPGPLAEILYRLSRSVGSADGMVAGQAWELEPTVDLYVYHACKTGATFEAATICGALAAGAQGDSWSALGRKLGAAYQAADDVADAFADPAWLGKPTGRDLALGRPSVALKMRPDQGPLLVTRLLEEAMKTVPSCGRDPGFLEWLKTVTMPMIQRKANPSSNA